MYHDHRKSKKSKHHQILITKKLQIKNVKPPFFQMPKAKSQERLKNLPN